MLFRRLRTFVLLFLVILAQYSLWFGKEGWVKVWRRRDKLAEWTSYNTTLLKRNQRLAAEVYNLLHGRSVMIERARYRLGLVAPSEVFFYVYDQKSPASNNAHDPKKSALMH